MKVREIQVKSVLTRSGLPGADWVINPYVGCAFGCQYCYAAFIGRWKHPGEEWGSFVDVKINAPEVLARELEAKFKKLKTKNFSTIFFGSVTDCYQGLEAKYQISHKCLQILADFGYKGEISILTKSPLVVRDVDLFKKLRCVVGLTITSLDDKVSRFLESNAPPVSLRFTALKELKQLGISTYAFVGPLLPYFVARKEILEEMFTELEKCGVEEIWIEHINLQSKIKERLFRYLRSKNPNLIPEFAKAQTKEYQNQLEELIFSLLKKRKLRLAGGKIIYHGKFK